MNTCVLCGDVIPEGRQVCPICIEKTVGRPDDMVAVVRCKNCKFWEYGDCYRLELSRPDDYCSYGERRATDG